nr:DNA-directed RNA polymerase II subunit 1-like [Penaeus vannamei]
MCTVTHAANPPTNPTLTYPQPPTQAAYPSTLPTKTHKTPHSPTHKPPHSRITIHIPTNPQTPTQPHIHPHTHIPYAPFAQCMSPDNHTRNTHPVARRTANFTTGHFKTKPQTYLQVPPKIGHFKMKMKTFPNGFTSVFQPREPYSPTAPQPQPHSPAAPAALQPTAPAAPQPHSPGSRGGASLPQAARRRRCIPQPPREAEAEAVGGGRRCRGAPGVAKCAMCHKYGPREPTFPVTPVQNPDEQSPEPPHHKTVVTFQKFCCDNYRFTFIVVLQQ